DGPARAVVFTGSGRAFSAGVDLWRVLNGGPEYGRRFLPALVEAFEAVFNAGKPVVAAVNGHAIAGGCILVSGCDHRIMGDAGRIGVTEHAVGVPFPVSALEILRFALGDRLARQAVFSAEAYGPAEALERGFVDELADSAELLPRAIATARRLATSTPADTFRVTKRLLRGEVNERLARLRPAADAETARLWEDRVRDGSIRAYMERVTLRAAGGPRGPLR
ncbi:MAG TPA: enoyl-CoA hydratase/isomerase family protein, partial [Pilimelia sp.]|nr:enoyl-CoA hydratase/isomerase family protein [Pilimelia sp.]